jgi:hypothetical protein
MSALRRPPCADPKNVTLGPTAWTDCQMTTIAARDALDYFFFCRVAHPN